MEELMLLGLPSAPAPSIQYRTLNLDWRLVSYMILYMFQCHSPKSSHPLPLPQSPKDCPIHQWYIYTMEYYSAIKKNTFESVLIRWMKLEHIIQSEASQKKKRNEHLKCILFLECIYCILSDPKCFVLIPPSLSS